MKLVSFDVETNGQYREYALQPFRVFKDQAWVTSFAWCVRGVCHGNLFPSVDQLRKFLTTCANQRARIVCWNAPFDMAWLIALGLRQEVYNCQWLDAMLLYRHLTITPLYLIPLSYGLKAAVAYFYPGQETYAQDIDFAATDPESLAKLQIYNREDAYHTLNLAEKFLADMPAPMRRNALIEAACLPMVAESYLTGLTVNIPAALALDKQLTEDHTVAFVKLKLSGAEITPEILASHMKLSKLLYENWRLVVPKLTDKGAFSTDKESLQILAVTDERAKWVRDYREAMTNKSKFVDSVVASVLYNGDGCTRPSAKIYGTYTGRMTYYSTQGSGVNTLQTGFAIHQMKRGKPFRDLITVPEGYELLEFDFAGQEFRWMAVESNDPTMLSMCQPGEDAHAYMGASINGIAYVDLKMRLCMSDDVLAPKLRLTGKFANLSCQYRVGASTLKRMAAIQYNLVLSDSEADKIHYTYQATYPRVPEYWRRAVYLAKKNGYAQTLGGRRVQLLPGDAWNTTNNWALSSTAINFPIQGVGADQKYLALMMLRDLLPRYNAKFYFELHDGLFVIVPKHKSEGACHDIRNKLSNLPYLKAWGFTPPILFPVDAKHGATWGSLEKLP